MLRNALMRVVFSHNIAFPMVGISAPAGLAVTPRAAWFSTARWSKDEEANFRAIEGWVATFKRESIPFAAMDKAFSRSSGPGGQNVNKVNSKAEVRFKLSEAGWLHALVRQRFLALHGRLLTAGGEVVITSEVHRTQRANLDECLDKLYKLVVECCDVPSETSPEQRERVQRLAEAADRRRLEAKKMAKSKKAARRPDDHGD